MIHVSGIYTAPPKTYKTPLQKETYRYLDKLYIPFERVETDEVITMEDCKCVEMRLDMKMVKTLFLCNRQKTLFFLFITTGSKPFHTKEFSQAMKTSRISFAPEELMQDMLGTKIGAATVFSAITDIDRDLQIVIDKDVAKEEYYGCSDGTTTCYLKIKTKDILSKFLPETKHKPVIIEI